MERIVVVFDYCSSIAFSKRFHKLCPDKHRGNCYAKTERGSGANAAHGMEQLGCLRRKRERGGHPRECADNGPEVESARLGICGRGYGLVHYQSHWGDQRKKFEV